MIQKHSFACIGAEVEKRTKKNEEVSSHSRLEEREVWKKEKEDAPEEKIKNNSEIKEKEKKQWVKSRKGQGVFRSKVLNEFNRCCIITGVDEEELLIASHIKSPGENVIINKH